jgi:hypothetical protein
MSGDTGRETHSQYWWNALPNKQSRHANRSNFTIFIDTNYLRNGAQIEIAVLPKEQRYLNEILQEAKYYKLLGLQDIVCKRLHQINAFIMPSDGSDQHCS